MVDDPPPAPAGNNPAPGTPGRPNPGTPGSTLAMLAAGAIAGLLIIVGVGALTLLGDDDAPFSPDERTEPTSSGDTPRSDDRQERTDSTRPVTDGEVVVGREENAASSDRSFESGSYRTTGLLDLVQLSGQPNWAERAAARINGATWTFDDNGSFEFAPTDSRTDLFPVRGQWSGDGNSIRFEAEANSSLGSTASAETLIYGTARIEDGSVIVEATWITTSGMAAVVGGTGFSSANGSAYEMTARLG